MYGSKWLWVLMSLLSLVWGAEVAHPRFTAESVERANKSANLLVFISITSGVADKHAGLRDAARASWLLPCVASPLCVYRFFVDASLPDDKLLKEQNLNGDVSFRSFCALMDRHPSFVHYGNALPIYSNETLPASLQDYPFRRFYKIDWKVCFLRYWQSWLRTHAPQNSSGVSKSIVSTVSFHAFVEDDSFVCTEHLLHQLGLLDSINIAARISGAKSPDTEDQTEPAAMSSTALDTAHYKSRPKPLPRRGLPFRTGTLLYDGFDDSSTLMSAEVADAFLESYRVNDTEEKSVSPVQPRRAWLLQGEEEWRCPHVPASGPNHNASIWLSWGNSWQSTLCGWRGALLHGRRRGLRINEPSMHCLKNDLESLRNFASSSSARRKPPPHRALLDLPTTSDYSGSPSPSPSPTAPPTPPPVPSLGSNRCRPAWPLVFHHSRAASVLHGLGAEGERRVCEAMLLIDKVKKPDDMLRLWTATTGNEFVDYSEVFLHDGYWGWLAVLGDNNTASTARRLDVRGAFELSAAAELRALGLSEGAK